MLTRRVQSIRQISVMGNYEEWLNTSKDMSDEEFIMTPPMPSKPSAEERAKAIRQTHFLNIALAGRSGQSGDIETACKYTVEAIVHAIQSAERDTANRIWEAISTAPRDGARIVVYDGKTVLMARWSEKFNDWINLSGVWAIQPTHWMPLPEPPNAN